MINEREDVPEDDATLRSVTRWHGGVATPTSVTERVKFIAAV